MFLLQSCSASRESPHPPGRAVPSLGHLLIVREVLRPVVRPRVVLRRQRHVETVLPGGFLPLVVCGRFLRVIDGPGGNSVQVGEQVREQVPRHGVEAADTGRARLLVDVGQVAQTA